MNIAIKNENINVMNSIDADIIKTLEGSFTKEEIISNLNNLYYNKVIIDISAINNYYDDNTLFDFLSYFGSEKVVIVLNNSELCNSPYFLKKLVEKGYYNFSKNAAGINFLINKPNTLEDVKKYLEGGSNLNPLNQSIVSNNNQKQRIIGIKNLMPHAGATTLMYMMIKLLKNNYSVKGIECQKNDSTYFKSDDIITCENLEELKVKINTLSNFNVIIIDLNELDESICNDVIYLMEPGTIRLNKFLKSNPRIQEFSKNHKIVLTRSMVTDKELQVFSYETRMSIFANITDFNERDNNNQSVQNMLNKLGFRV